MKKIQEEIDQTYQEMREVAMEIVDGLDIENDIGDDYTCFIDKELYDLYLELNTKHTALHEALKKEDEKQIKLPFKN
jgi:hypothetical protein